MAGETELPDPLLDLRGNGANVHAPALKSHVPFLWAPPGESMKSMLRPWSSFQSGPTAFRELSRTLECGGSLVKTFFLRFHPSLLVRFDAGRGRRKTKTNIHTHVFTNV